MFLLTSYFGRAQSLPKHFNLVSIARYTPYWWTGAKAPQLAPTENILINYKRDGDWDKYMARFQMEVLNRLNPKKIAENLEIYFGNSNPVCLLCYEKDADRCHRSLVARWLSENTNIEVLGEYDEVKINELD